MNFEIRKAGRDIREVLRQANSRPESTRDDLNRPERGLVEGMRNDVARIRSEGRGAPRSGRFGSGRDGHPATTLSWLKTSA